MRRWHHRPLAAPAAEERERWTSGPQRRVVSSMQTSSSWTSDDVLVDRVDEPVTCLSADGRPPGTR